MLHGAWAHKATLWASLLPWRLFLPLSGLDCCAQSTCLLNLKAEIREINTFHWIFFFQPNRRKDLFYYYFFYLKHCWLYCSLWVVFFFCNWLSENVFFVSDFLKNKEKWESAFIQDLICVQAALMMHPSRSIVFRPASNWKHYLSLSLLKATGVSAFRLLKAASSVWHLALYLSPLWVVDGDSVS